MEQLMSLRRLATGIGKAGKNKSLTCITVMHSDALMPASDKSRVKRGTKKATRITVTLPQDNYDTVVRMAKNKRVSTAWIVRDAVDKYLAADTPLFGKIAA
jgi:hypothetical protein